MLAAKREQKALTGYSYVSRTSSTHSTNSVSSNGGSGASFGSSANTIGAAGGSTNAASMNVEQTMNNFNGGHRRLDNTIGLNRPIGSPQVSPISANTINTGGMKTESTQIESSNSMGRGVAGNTQPSIERIGQQIVKVEDRPTLVNDDLHDMFFANILNSTGIDASTQRSLVTIVRTEGQTKNDISQNLRQFAASQDSATQINLQATIGELERFVAESRAAEERQLATLSVSAPAIELRRTLMVSRGCRRKATFCALEACRICTTLPI